MKNPLVIDVLALYDYFGEDDVLQTVLRSVFDLYILAGNNITDPYYNKKYQCQILKSYDFHHGSDTKIAKDLLKLYYNMSQKQQQIFLTCYSKVLQNKYKEAHNYPMKTGLSHGVKNATCLLELLNNINNPFNEQNNNTNTKDTNTKDTNTKDINTKDINTKDTNTTDTNTKDPNTKDPNTKESENYLE